MISLKSIKFAWLRRKLWFPGLVHFVAASFIVFITVWFYYREGYCQVGFDIFCSLEQRNRILKIASSISQVVGVFLILYSLNTKMHLLRGKGLVNHAIRTFINWVGHFKPRNYVLDVKAAMMQIKASGSISISIDFDTSDVSKALVRLKKELERQSNEIDKLRADKLAHEEHVKTEIKRLEDNVESVRLNLEKLIDDLNVGGLTPQVWSLFLIIYSATLSVIV